MKYNIKSVKNINIEVTGTVVEGGIIGVHSQSYTDYQGLELFHVTHIPTGRSIHRFYDEGLAIECAKELSSTIPEFTQKYKSEIQRIILKYDALDDDLEDHL